jgi:hypothetical protein
MTALQTTRRQPFRPLSRADRLASVRRAEKTVGCANGVAMIEDRIIAFYSGGTDDRGRTLEHILAWPDEELEMVHDYIQWVFPTITRSGVNWRAPLVRDTTRAAFASQPALGDALRRSLDRMLAFYGLCRTVNADGVRIAIDPARFAERAPEWLDPGNHNHLRLTRIMQSLAALGLLAEAQALQRCLLTEIYDGVGKERITRETYAYWTDAVPRQGLRR